jgi:hypothetical protein
MNTAELPGVSATVDKKSSSNTHSSSTGPRPAVLAAVQLVLLHLQLAALCGRACQALTAAAVAAVMQVNQQAMHLQL